MRIVINADDAGLTAGVSAGIVAAVTDGIVAGTTAMACVAQAEGRVRATLARLGQRIGVHLQLTGGRPCLAPALVPSLVGPDGCFPAHAHQLRAACPREIALEWRAQVERLMAWGVVPTHLDSHHHVHSLQQALPVFIALAQGLGCPTRGGDALTTRRIRAAGVACPDYLVMLSRMPVLDPARLLGQLRLAQLVAGPDAVIELGCHPGYNDAALARVSSYTARRQEELALLTSSALRVALASAGVQWGPFAGLARPGVPAASRKRGADARA